MNTPLNRQPQVVEAADATKEAWLVLKRTDIRSPVTGYIAQRSVQVGETVSSGEQSLMAVVPARQMWVNANFKETQLTDVRIGQSVNIISDLYGENVVFHGRVTGINMGTGNVFSLLPAQNATGNWIKSFSVYRLKFLYPKELMEHPLRIGLSMTATIDTKDEDIAEMPDLASTVTSMPAYTSKALVIDTSPIEKEISNIISHNGQL
ncbi:HlyD family secretion protein [Shigella flexneri]